MARWQDELVRRARDDLPVPLFRYLSQGARDGVTAAEASRWLMPAATPAPRSWCPAMPARRSLTSAPPAPPGNCRPTCPQTALWPSRCSRLPSEPGSEKATDLGPRDAGWLHDTTGLPVVVKGVMRPDDARRAIQAGAGAVWVSNHGGRQLDRTVSTAVALPSVVRAVGDEAEVYVDGVCALHHELRLELTEPMRLAGCRTVADAPGITVPEP